MVEENSGHHMEAKVTNEEVRKRTGMGNFLNILRRNRLRWLGHVNRMSSTRLPKQALQWLREKAKEKEEDHARPGREL